VKLFEFVNEQNCSTKIWRHYESMLSIIHHRWAVLLTKESLYKLKTWYNIQSDNHLEQWAMGYVNYLIICDHVRKLSMPKEF
jgi:hypothetical protein